MFSGHYHRCSGGIGDVGDSDNRIELRDLQDLLACEFGIDRANSIFYQQYIFLAINKKQPVGCFFVLALVDQLLALL
jgi:hypothetical protein